MKYYFSVFYFAEFQAPSVFKKYCLSILFLFLLLTPSSFPETPNALSGIANAAVGDSLNLVKILTRENGKLLYAAGVGDVNNDGYADFIATDYIISSSSFCPPLLTIMLPVSGEKSFY